MTTNALERQAILRASTISSGIFLFIMYAKYGCIQVTLIIMTSYGSSPSFAHAILAPESAIDCGFSFLEPEGLVSWIGLSIISSQNTPGGMGRYWDPIFASISASSLLALLT
jgi:hypothetical protein